VPVASRQRCCSAHGPSPDALVLPSTRTSRSTRSYRRWRYRHPVQRDADIATRVQRLERTFTHLTIPFTVKKRAAMSPNEVVEAMSPLIDDMERYIPAPAGLVRVGRATVSPAPATSAKAPRGSRRLTEAEAAHAAQVQTLDGELQEAAGIEPEAVQGDPKLVNPFLCDPPLSYLATKGLWMVRVIR
jgi:hypothetical protein